MRLVCDLEVHSKYARAVSKQMDVMAMAEWAQRKGIDLVGTGDFTHPAWFSELSEALEEDGTGLLRRKTAAADESLRFMLTGEVSLIYSQGGRGRRVHIIVAAPSFAAAQAISDRLAVHGKLASDGRPVLGLSAKQLLAYVLEVPGAFIIPAHVWTPWFGLFGSKSGFDFLEECFEELTPEVRAIETGLSSDLPMNWRLSQNDRLALVSFSDAHSAPNLMREATVISVTDVTYDAVAAALQNPRRQQQQENAILHTLEFFPQEGKYHYDGIAALQRRLHPSETEALRQTDPALAKKVTVGVLSRIATLADRPEGYVAPDRPGSYSVIPLQEIIADRLGVGKQSKRVQACYQAIVAEATEYQVLVELSAAELQALMPAPIAEAVLAVRQGEVRIESGYDGVYGTIQITKSR